ncbi:ArsR/SmtB family transcription factor [Streptomyces fructofermentans]|uniref:Transcriptional regulator n=1 Tax=Streptomyces fructofermentans TaxID=152141 RepID=A0A918NUL1_9ACTN|nr:helix-turn-helix domain-containing protein [Streptomyces fructofermentans]GGX97727.1 transcriptional regulator [Streptomyces fructofermentans]
MPEPEDWTTRVLDARSLRGLAHPLRMALLNALRRGGPATASQLAAKLGESSGATSYHLRQLASHGFVEDAPEHGKGRERWWRAVHRGVQFDDSLLKDPDPAVRGAADLFLHEVAGTHTREVATWLGTTGDWPLPWQRASDMSDMTLRLTPEQAEDLIAKLHDLVAGYRERAPDENTPDAETVRVHTHVFPTHTD